MAQMPFFEVNQAITYSGGEDLNLCMQCGLCAGICPWREVGGEFFVRRMIKQGQLGLEGFESDDILYGCTTCNKCVINCPRGVEIIDIMRAMRSMIAETGAIPETLKTVLGSCHSHGDPWSEPREKRMDWTSGADVPIFTEDTEYFLFVCCTSCYDLRSRKIALSVVELLKKAGVSFGVIGTEESCCGESVRKIGDEAGFTKLAQGNISLFKDKGVKKIITTSPHCFYTFANEYPEFGGEFEVYHSSQVLAKLVEEGKLSPKGESGKKIAYHDPCYLGRHSEVYDKPRYLLEATGAESIKMEREEAFSLCCGGGGGRLWMETMPEQRFSDLRVREAFDAGAEILATACPYCISMLEDSLKTTDLEEQLQVKDISEILLESC
ncbi:MAG: (Fe-S)-binding protein [Deltaproteobacteria bacterium]|nr:(Fe-S)-binding protein [Deltaproteobacteria bacterium]